MQLIALGSTSLATSRTLVTDINVVARDQKMLSIKFNRISLTSEIWGSMTVSDGREEEGVQKSEFLSDVVNEGRHNFNGNQVWVPGYLCSYVIKHMYNHDG